MIKTVFNKKFVINTLYTGNAIKLKIFSFNYPWLFYDFQNQASKVRKILMSKSDGVCWITNCYYNINYKHYNHNLLYITVKKKNK